MKHYLIDGDGILYAAACALQREVWWDDHTRTITMDVAEALDVVFSSIDAIGGKDDLKTVFIAGARRNFRHDLWPDYKKARRSKDLPVGMKTLRDWFMEQSPWMVLTAPGGLETDDMLGIHMTGISSGGRYHEATRILYSPDKDLAQIPGWHVDAAGKEWFIPKAEADYNHLFQTLTGDATDGYPGCKGVGPVAASKILDPSCQGTAWERVVKAYEKAGFDEAFALNQARVARILRYGEEPGQWRPEE